MKQYKIVLGIELGSDFIRIAEVEHREEEYFLSKVAERKIGTIQSDELVKTLSLLMNEESIMGRVASVAIDTRMIARDTIDIDANLGSDDIASFLRAEIDSHNKFSAKSYIPAYEFTKSNVDPYREVFYAAMEKELLFTLRDSCTRCGLDLRFVDLDHSCSELAINKLNKNAGNYILITVKEGQVEASFCADGERMIYKYIAYSGEPFYFITKAAEELEFKSKIDPARIFLTGSAADSFLVDLLRKNVDERYELFAPSGSMKLSSVASEYKELKEHPHLYSHAIGAALK